MVGPCLEALKPHWKIMVSMVVCFFPALFSFTGAGTEHVESWILSRSQVIVIRDHGIVAGEEEG